MNYVKMDIPGTAAPTTGRKLYKFQESYALQTPSIDQGQFIQTMNDLSTEELEWLEQQMMVFESEFSKPSQKMAKAIREADTS